MSIGRPIWFDAVRREFRPRAMEFAGKPITYVEIGCWEGVSAAWVAKEILTHPESRGFGIDPYQEMRKVTQEQMTQIRELAHRSVVPHHSGQWTWIEQPSIDVLTGWDHGEIDLLYIDGHHTSMNVILDFALCWPYLKVGSGVIFDDYAIGGRQGPHGVPEAITAIDIAFGNALIPWGDNHIRMQAAYKVRSKTADKEWFLGQKDKRLWLEELRREREQQVWME